MIWRPVPSAAGFLANDRGEILGPGGPVKTAVASNGYVRCWVKSRMRYVHALVCEAFHGQKPTPAHQVAHCDGIKVHNEPFNLRWATSKENHEDKCLHGTWQGGENQNGAILTEAQAAEIRRLYSENMGRQYVKRGTRETLAARYGVSTATIKSVVSGKTWRHVSVDLPFLPPPN